MAARRASGGRGTVVPSEGASRVKGGLSNEKTSEWRSERRCLSVCVWLVFRVPVRQLEWSSGCPLPAAWLEPVTGPL